MVAFAIFMVTFLGVYITQNPEFDGPVEYTTLGVIFMLLVVPFVVFGVFLG